MKLIILVLFTYLALADWQDGTYKMGIDGIVETWDGVWDWEIYDMIVLNEDLISETYGTVRLKIPRPFNWFGKVSTFDFDQKRQAWGKRWMFGMTTKLNPSGPFVDGPN